jgi:Protein of unknown function (DUF4435)
MNDKFPLGLREARSPHGEAASIRLRRSTFTGVFLLVEGYSDRRFYERFVGESTCQIVSVSGKPSSKLRVITVLEILEKSGFQGVLAIVDADFDRLAPSPVHTPNLLRTIIFKSFALNKVIAEFGSEEKIAKLGREVRTALLESGISVGYLRWISIQNGLNLTFEGITFSKFMDEQTLQTNEPQMIQEVKNKSQAFSLDSEKVQQQLTTLKVNRHDPWQVCCGHDLVEILSLGLRKAIGSARATDVEPSSLERNLRLAYEEAYFDKTQLYSDIRAWESLNLPFVVLRDGI